MQYLAGIWAARYFWIHLALSDLRTRWRRSYLGALWSIIQPLGMTVLISFVLGRLMHVSVHEYAPYILSGIIFWEYLSSTAISGAVAFVQNEPYIKQYRHPLAIYTLRTALANLLTMVLASVALFAWVLTALPGDLNWTWLCWPLSIPVMLLIGWPLATSLAYLSVRYRDIPYALSLILQAIWFVSPVYFETQFFRKAGLNALIDYNPLYHMLQLVRAPLLYGKWPSFANYGVCIGTIVVLAAIAFALGRRYERNVILYL